MDDLEAKKGTAVELSEAREPKIGVRRASGKPPGYRWWALILDGVYEEALRLVGGVGCRHLAMQVKELALQDDPTHSQVVDVKKMEGHEFLEIRDKGGPLGNVNVRLFFGVSDATRSIVVLGVIKKQNDGRTPLGDLLRMSRRWRQYKAWEGAIRSTNIGRFRGMFPDENAPMESEGEQA
jgi:hypothetical protein